MAFSRKGMVVHKEHIRIIQETFQGTVPKVSHCIWLASASRDVNSSKTFFPSFFSLIPAKEQDWEYVLFSVLKILKNRLDRYLSQRG